MLDHLHILLRVEEELDEILGRKIVWFKLLVNKKAGRNGVFAPGSHDCILNPDREAGLHLSGKMIAREGRFYV